MAQAPIPDPALVPLVREKLDAIEGNRELVAKALAGETWVRVKVTDEPKI